MAYETTGVVLDGSTSLFGTISCTDSRYMYCSFWIRTTVDVNDVAVFVVDPVDTYWTYLGFDESLSSMYFEGADATLTETIYRDYWGHRYTNDRKWHHHLFAIDSDGLVAAYYVDDVYQYSSDYDGIGVPTINFNGLPLWVFDDSFGFPVTGEVADFTISVGTNLIVGTEIPDATRRLFTTVNVDLSIVPNDPAGFPDATPIVLFKGGSSTFATNAGDGGSFTLVGSLVDSVEEVMFSPPEGTFPFTFHDPLLPDLDGPEPELAGTGYRSVLQLFHSPTYHPDTVLLLAVEDEDNVEGDLAIASFSASTGTLTNYVVLDYDGPGTPMNWNTVVAPIYWPPTSDYIYSVRGESQFTGDSTTTWFVQWDATYPFAFVAKSPTPSDRGKSEQYQIIFDVMSNKDGSLIFGGGGGSLVPPNVHVKFGLWHPGSNSVSYFRTDDPSFSSRYGNGSGIAYILPDNYCFDADDHFWTITSANLDGTDPIYLDEYSWSVGGGDVILTHLNRYNVTPQVSGHNTWRYAINGFTFNESTNCLVITWTAAQPSWTYTPQDPTPVNTISNISDSNNEPAQIRITHWSVTDRTQLLEEADSVRLAYTQFESEDPAEYADEILAGVMGFAGATPLESGDHTMGYWSNQDWMVTVDYNDITSQTDAFIKYDINTGTGIRYDGSLWGDRNDSNNNVPGVYTWAGAIWIEENESFWAVRRGQGVWWKWSEPAAFPGPPDGVFQEQILGLGIYSFETVVPEDCPPCEEDLTPCGTTVEPDPDGEWPHDMLRPRDVGIHKVPATLGGGTAYGGLEQVQGTKSGFWRVSYRGVMIRSKAQRRAFRQLEIAANGRSGVLRVPLFDSKRAPWVSTPGGAISVTTPSGFIAGATTGTLQSVSAGVLFEGMHFSYNDRVYRIDQISGPVAFVYSVTIWPPVRTAIPAAASLEFRRPTLRVRLKDDDGMALKLELLKHGMPDVDFEEDI